MNKPKLTRLEKKIKLKEEKAHLMILDVLAHKEIIMTLQEYKDRVKTIIDLVMDGALMFEREGFEFTEKTVEELRKEMFEVTTYDNLEEEDDDIPFELVDH